MAEPNPLSTGLAIFGLTLFVDLLDLSFARALFFLATLRFWLYFALHWLVSVLAAYLVHEQLPQWFLLAPAATFLGVAVISNTNVKIAGYSLLPVADLFTDIRKKVFEQAAEERLAQVTRAEAVERLQRIGVERVEQVHRAALVGVGWSGDRIEREIARAKASSNYRAALIGQLVNVNLPYVLKNLEAWEHDSG